MRFRIDLSHPDLKRYVKLTLPLMVGLTMTFSTEFFFKFFGSYLPRGSIAGLNYALRVMMMMVAFFGQAVGVASYPFMARMAAENKLSDMNRILDRTLQYLAVILPISALFIVLRKEIVFLLFQRGRFGPDAAAFTAEVLLYLLIGAFAFATQTIVVRGYYAVQNTIFPTVFGSIAVLISIPIYYLGMHLMGARGVALAVSLSAMLQVGLLYILWARRFPAPGRSAVYRSYGLMAVIALVVGAILSTIKTYALSGFSASTVWQSMLVCLVIGAVFVTLMLGIGYLFKIREITLLADRLIRR